MANGGCGPIAIYNALMLTGHSGANLPQIIYYTEMADGLAVNGKFGSSPNALGDVLAQYGVDYQASSWYGDIAGNMQDGNVAIMLIVNDDTIFSGMHYITTQKVGDQYVVYNNRVDDPQNELWETMNGGSFVYGYLIQ